MVEDIEERGQNSSSSGQAADLLNEGLRHLKFRFQLSLYALGFAILFCGMMMMLAPIWISRGVTGWLSGVLSLGLFVLVLIVQAYFWSKVKFVAATTRDLGEYSKRTTNLTGEFESLTSNLQRNRYEVNRLREEINRSLEEAKKDPSKVKTSYVDAYQRRIHQLREGAQATNQALADLSHQLNTLESFLSTVGKGDGSSSPVAEKPRFTLAPYLETLREYVANEPPPRRSRQRAREDCGESKAATL